MNYLTNQCPRDTKAPQNTVQMGLSHFEMQKYSKSQIKGKEKQQNHRINIFL